MDFAVRPRGGALIGRTLLPSCVLLASCVQSAAQGASSPDTVAVENWALARCFAKVASGTPAGDDAAKSAAAYLERATADIDVYEKLDTVIDEALAQRRSGSVKSDYNTMKCIDLFRGPELKSVVESATDR